MNDEQRPSSIGDLTLDKTWDAYVDHAGSLASDPVIQMLHKQRIPRPAPSFVEHLRQQIVQDASEPHGVTIRKPKEERVDDRMNHARAISVDRRRTFVPPSSATGVSRWASIALVAAILLAVVGGSWYANRTNPTNPPTSIPAASIQDATPGSLALLGVPSVTGQSALTGQHLAMANGMLIVVAFEYVAAVEPGSLDLIWKTEMTAGSYSEPAFDANTLYLGFSTNSESAVRDENDDQLVAISLDTGEVLWRLDGMGSSGSTPLVDGTSMYSTGRQNGNIALARIGIADRNVDWTLALGPEWCCPMVGTALSGETLLVTFENTLRAVNTTDGSTTWEHEGSDDAQIYPPVVVDEQVVAPWSDLPQSVDADNDYAVSRSGGIVSLDIATGTEAWTNDAPSSLIPTLMYTGQLLYQGTLDDERASRLISLSPDDGTTEWSTVLLDKEEMDWGWPNAPAQIGSQVIAYERIGNANSVGLPATRLSAVEAETGSSQWSVDVDGWGVSRPVVIGRDIFLLTENAGLLRLSSSSFVPETAAVIDIRSHVTCTAPRLESPLLGELPMEPTIPWLTPGKAITAHMAELPDGPAVDTTTAENLDRLFRDYRVCSGIDPYHGVFWFFSTDFFVRLNQMDETYYDNRESPWPIWMSSMNDALVLDIGTLVEYGDGRIAGMVRGTYFDFYIWFANEGGQWKIDEYHGIIETPDATPEASAAP